MPLFFGLDDPLVENRNQGAESIESIEKFVSILRGQEKTAMENVVTADETSGHKIRISSFEGLDLHQYRLAKAENCRQYHECCKSGCREMVNAADIVIRQQCIPLGVLWRKCFPSKPYDCEKSQRRLLQMPVACIRFQHGLVVVQKSRSNSYSGVISEILQMNKMTLVTGNTKKEVFLEKESCQDLLKSATATSEVQRLKHVISSTHNLSQREARNLGIRNLRKRAKQVEEVTKVVRTIRSKHKYFAKVEQRVFLDSQGVDYHEYLSSDSDTESHSSSESEYECTETKDSKRTSLVPLDIEETLLGKKNSITTAYTEANVVSERGRGKDDIDVKASTAMALEILKELKFNWFALVTSLEPEFSSQGYTQEDFDNFLMDFASQLQNLELSDEELKLTEQSRVAYLDEMLVKEARSEIIVEENTENYPTDNVEVADVDGETIHLGLRRIKDKARKRARAEVEACGFFKKAGCSRPDAITKRHPDIGEVMEKMVADADIGADKWRRTGVYTFSGDTKKEKRITFRTLADKLSNHYNEKISYGTVVQLCIPRNKRKLSRKRYKGVANIKYQRARKGFNIKLNPDAKWSRSFYKCLDKLQRDGQHILLLNRDDQAGFRLDSTYTHKSSPSFTIDSPSLTTHTDFLNKHPTQLQTTSYNFSSTSTTSEVCCGVVKASAINEKNPSQHAADLKKSKSFHQYFARQMNV